MTIYALHFPPGFDLSDLVQPEPIMGRDDRWYFTVYGKIKEGAPALTYMCRWKIGQALVEFVPLEHYATARGSPASDGDRLWLFALDSGKRLCVQTVPDWTPPADATDAALIVRIAALEAQIAQLQQTIAHLPPTVTGPIVVIPERNATSGALLVLKGVGEDWGFDVGATGVLRLTQGGAVVERWPK